MCGSEKIKTNRSTSCEDNIIRRRLCKNCGHAWSTVEIDMDQWESVTRSFSKMKYVISQLEALVEEMKAKILKLGGTV
jgi:transcriptional regulator NrdR family protein